jgi:DNA-binding SARP family transcriptional activator/tetratricopeptide (TPR) repeat protein
MSKLELRFLGIFNVAQDGVTVTSFESNKVRAMLAYLAVESQRAHARGVMATLLWPDWPNRAALSNLRYALSDLRKVISDRGAEPPFLLISREAIQFNAESDHWQDVADLTRLAEAQDVERLEQAVMLYHGDFLDGFSVSEAAPFEDWMRLKREQLRRSYLEAMHRLAALLEVGGKLELALGYAWRLVDLEPLDENAQRLLMRLLVLSGRRGKALAQYATCRKVLDMELGAVPSAETDRLHELILAGQLEASTPAIRITTGRKPPAFMQAVNESEIQLFVAREQELGQLNRSLDSTLNGKGRVAFVTGDAGRGKTALLREFARQASEAYPELLVAAGSCNPYSGVGDPYLPLRSVLRTLMGNLELAGSSGMIDRVQALRLWQTMPQALQALVEHGFYLVDTFLPGNELLTLAEAKGVSQLGLRQAIEKALNPSSHLAQQHLFEQYCAVLRALSREYPLLIVLDDLQWVDSASAGLLYHLGTRLEGSRILVLCAYRPEEIALGRDGDRHPLEKALAEFKRLYGDAWLDLTHSDKRKGRNFIDVFLDSEPNRLGHEFRERLFHHTEGHPLFTIELLRAMQERGELLRDGQGFWIEGPVLDWEQLPSRVEAVIAERIGRLEPTLRETLSIASVEGEDFTAQVVARVQQVNDRMLLHELSEELVKHHRLVHEQGEVLVAGQTLWRYRFAHALHQKYLYNHLGSPERRLIHEAIAVALEELYTDRTTEIAARLAYHWQRAKDADKAREFTLLAGQEALAAFANQIAEGYFRQALELGPTIAQRATLLAGLGEALRRQARREEAVRVLQEGIDLYSQLEYLDGIADLYKCLSSVLFRHNRLEAWNACQEGLERLEEAADSPGLARLLAEAGRIAYFLIEPSAENLCKRAMDMAERLGVLEAQVDASITLAMIIGDVYRKPRETIQALQRVIPFCETHDLWYSAARAHSNLGVYLYMYDTDTYSAYQHIFQAAILHRKVGDVERMLFSLDTAALASLPLGNLTSVESMVAEFLQQSTAPAERIEISLENISNELLFYRGEWAQACQYYRTTLAICRNQHDVNGITGSNNDLAEANVELHRLTGSGDLVEAEAALVENLKSEEFIPITQTLLVKVYSLQHRFTDAHAVLVELLKGPPLYRFDAKASHAMAEQRWNQAATLTLSLINLLQTMGRRWEWARALIYLGDIYAQREHPGDSTRARVAYQQSLDMFSEMEATGYIQVLRQRLQALRTQ